MKKAAVDMFFQHFSYEGGKYITLPRVIAFSQFFRKIQSVLFCWAMKMGRAFLYLSYYAVVPKFE